jgi:hypothetical protein
MACSDKETALREILGDKRVDAALSCDDQTLKKSLAAPEISRAAGQALSALSLGTYVLQRGASRGKAREEAKQELESLSSEALDLLLVAVCAKHRLETR